MELIIKFYKVPPYIIAKMYTYTLFSYITYDSLHNKYTTFFMIKLYLIIIINYSVKKMKENCL